MSNDFYASTRSSMIINFRFFRSFLGNDHRSCLVSSAIFKFGECTRCLKRLTGLGLTGQVLLVLHACLVELTDCPLSFSPPPPYSNISQFSSIVNYINTTLLEYHSPKCQITILTSSSLQSPSSWCYPSAMVPCFGGIYNLQVGQSPIPTNMIDQNMISVNIHIASS